MNTFQLNPSGKNMILHCCDIMDPEWGDCWSNNTAAFHLHYVINCTMVNRRVAKALVRTSKESRILPNQAVCQATPQFTRSRVKDWASCHCATNTHKIGPSKEFRTLSSPCPELNGTPLPHLSPEASPGFEYGRNRKSRAFTQPFGWGGRWFGGKYRELSGPQRSNIILPPRPILPWKRYGRPTEPFSTGGAGGCTMPAAANLPGSSGLVNKNTGSFGSCNKRYCVNLKAQS